MEEKILEGDGKLLSNSKQFLLPLLCGRVISEVIVFFSLLFCFSRHQFVENNLILKMGPVDKRKVRGFLNFL